ncbi:UNKNOWN [Stylonychia lemnae]|uniref:Uncharacterized protein n=1 Tax=Stylonychia lemnae TaxID=5949 RepID=A0A078B8D4_STYLE|nr:UNKNOWN [Stylonychia lemnae]|eukprot:CDW89552.1 UNKNOWN [Stylonychia lemnae]
MDYKESKLLRKHYRDITFDTLKNRHDNFFFEKVLQTKNQIYDTMHFKGILKNPNTPKLILFQKLGQPHTNRDFSYDQYQMNFSDTRFFRDFKNKIESEFDKESMIMQTTNNNYNKRNQESEGKLWREFHSHFNRRTRDKGLMNHHDFLDLPSINYHGNSEEKSILLKQQQNYTEGYLLDQERQINQRKNLEQMKLKSIQIPLNSKFQTHRKKFNKSHFDVPLYQAKKMNQSLVEDTSEKQKNSQPTKVQIRRQMLMNQEEKSRQSLSKHFIYIIVDGCNIYDQDTQAYFVDINERLALMVPEKIWQLKTAEKLNIYEKLNLSAPAYILQKQNLNEFLQDLSQIFKQQFRALFTLHGQRITSLVQVPLQAKILVASISKVFISVLGIDNLENQLNTKSHRSSHQSRLMQIRRENSDEKHTSMHSWVQGACIEWVRKNDKFMNDSVILQNNKNIQFESAEVSMEEHNESKPRFNFKPGPNSTQRFQLGRPRPSEISPRNKPSFIMSELYDLWSEIFIHDQLEDEIVKLIFQKIDHVKELEQQKVTKNIMEEYKSSGTRFSSNAARLNSSLGGQQKQSPTDPNNSFTKITQRIFQRALNSTQTRINPREDLNSSIMTFQDITKNRATFMNRSKVNDSSIDQSIDASIGNNQPTTNFNQSVMSMRRTSKVNTGGLVSVNPNGYIPQTAPVTVQTISIHNNDDKMLKNEEIKRICEKHRLTRKEVYDIRSQFVSMCILSKEDEQNPDKEQSILFPTGQSNTSRMGQYTALLNKGNKQEQEGILINYFVKNCSFLSGTLPHICKRILVAIGNLYNIQYLISIGLDIENAHAQVNWPTFLELYCIFEAGRIERSLLAKFWIKFFDQKLMGQVSETEYLTILEELVRGNSFKKPNKTTKMFAKMFQKVLRDAGCLGDNNEIIDEKFNHALTDDLIDIQILCSALGRQQLDENFMKTKL